MIKIAGLQFNEHHLVEVLIKVASSLGNDQAAAPLVGKPSADTRPEPEVKDQKTLKAKEKVKKPKTEGPKGAELLDPDKNVAYMSQIMGNLEDSKQRKAREEKQQIKEWVKKRLKGDEVTDSSEDHGESGPHAKRDAQQG